MLWLASIFGIVGIGSAFVGLQDEDISEEDEDAFDDEQEIEGETVNLLDVIGQGTAGMDLPDAHEPASAVASMSEANLDPMIHFAPEPNPVDDTRADAPRFAPQGAGSDGSDPDTAEAPPFFREGGSESDDVLTGGAGNDQFHGYGGDDTIIGGAGRDHMHGGDGNDQISGGTEDDGLHGENGDDRLDGGGGSDTVFGGAGNDTIDGGADADSLSGGLGDDSITGGPGDDTLRGNHGDDTLRGGAGTDNIGGGKGSDLLDGSDDDGLDYLDGGTGDDTILGGQQDVMTGGAGADLFSVALETDPSAPAQIMDYSSEDDTLVLTYDADAMEAPEITVTEDPEISGLMHVQIGGQDVALVHNAAGLSVADIQVIAQSAT